MLISSLFVLNSFNKFTIKESDYMIEKRVKSSEFPEEKETRKGNGRENGWAGGWEKELYTFC